MSSFGRAAPVFRGSNGRIRPKKDCFREIFGPRSPFPSWPYQPRIDRLTNLPSTADQSDGGRPFCLWKPSEPHDYPLLRGVSPGDEGVRGRHEARVTGSHRQPGQHREPEAVVCQQGQEDVPDAAEHQGHEDHPLAVEAVGPHARHQGQQRAGVLGSQDQSLLKGHLLSARTQAPVPISKSGRPRSRAGDNLSYI